MNQPDTFTIEQVREYVEGWLGADDDMQTLTIDQIKAMLSNALVCVDDPSDGIREWVEREKEYTKQLFDNYIQSIKNK